MRLTHQKSDLTLFLKLKLLRSPHDMMTVLLSLSQILEMLRRRSQVCRRLSQSRCCLCFVFLTQSQVTYLRQEARLRLLLHLRMLLRLPESLAMNLTNQKSRMKLSLTKMQQHQHQQQQQILAMH